MRLHTTLFLCLFILKQLPLSTLQPIEATESDEDEQLQEKRHEQLQEEQHQQLQEEHYPQHHEEEEHLHEQENDENRRDGHEEKEESNNEEKPVNESIEEPEVNTETHNINFNKESFSFQTFRGPVKGVAREVTVPNSNLRNGKIHAVDFVVKPDYSYSYGVHDKNSGNSHTHSESRDGDDVKGEYRVLQSDGLVRIVKYNAHPTTGFRVTVEYVKSDDSSS